MVQISTHNMGYAVWRLGVVGQPETTRIRFRYLNISVVASVVPFMNRFTIRVS